jgi:hypothetical protein
MNNDVFAWMEEPCNCGNVYSYPDGGDAICAYCNGAESLRRKIEKDTIEITQWRNRALRAESAIKQCAIGACPTLAQLAMEDMGWETPFVAAGTNENPPHKSPLPKS